MGRWPSLLLLMALLAGLASLLFRTPSPRSPAPALLNARSPPPAIGPCQATAAFADAAIRNGASLDTVGSGLAQEDPGWEIYAPLAAHEIGSACGPQTAGFAAALAGWQRSRGMAATGTMDATTLGALNLTWIRRRPFVAATSGGACPAAPPPEALAWARPEEGYAGKAVQLRATALAAYRRMLAVARAQVPAAAADRRLLSIFSGYRGPDEEAQRCALGCDRITRANCSAHRTGLAVDLFLGAAPGFPPESTAAPNRLAQSRSPTYRWLVANAGRFGFVNYPFEPWHWEWTGEPP